jgi:hypothetical protein
MSCFIKRIFMNRQSLTLLTNRNFSGIVHIITRRCNFSLRFFWLGNFLSTSLANAPGFRRYESELEKDDFMAFSYEMYNMATTALGS